MFAKNIIAASGITTTKPISPITVDIIEISATKNDSQNLFILFFFLVNIALNKPVFSAKPIPSIENKNITRGVNDINVESTFPIKYLAPSLENKDSTDTKVLSNSPVIILSLW